MSDALELVDLGEALRRACARHSVPSRCDFYDVPVLAEPQHLADVLDRLIGLVAAVGPSQFHVRLTSRLLTEEAWVVEIRLPDERMTQSAGANSLRTDEALVAFDTSMTGGYTIRFGKGDASTILSMEIPLDPRG